VKKFSLFIEPEGWESSDFRIFVVEALALLRCYATNPNVHNRIHNSPPVVSILSHVDVIHPLHGNFKDPF